MRLIFKISSCLRFEDKFLKEENKILNLIENLNSANDICSNTILIKRIYKSHKRIENDAIFHLKEARNRFSLKIRSNSSIGIITTK